MPITFPAAMESSWNLTKVANAFGFSREAQPQEPDVSDNSSAQRRAPHEEGNSSPRSNESSPSRTSSAQKSVMRNSLKKRSFADMTVEVSEAIEDMFLTCGQEGPVAKRQRLLELQQQEDWEGLQQDYMLNTKKVIALARKSSRRGRKAPWHDTWLVEGMHPT